VAAQSDVSRFGDEVLRALPHLSRKAPQSSLVAVPLSWVCLRLSVAQRCQNASLAELWTIGSTQIEGDGMLVSPARWSGSRRPINEQPSDEPATLIRYHDRAPSSPLAMGSTYLEIVGIGAGDVAVQRGSSNSPSRTPTRNASHSLAAKINTFP
jgi:hypothetical protein